MRTLFSSFSLGFGLFAASAALAATPALPEASVLEAKLVLANDYFMAKWPDPGKSIVTNRERPSNIWTRGVYYEGMMELYRRNHDPRLLDYAIRWGEAHKWGVRKGPETRNADDHCAGQTYIELYRLDPKPERIREIKASMDLMISKGGDDDWWWIDALQMAMPVFAKLGVETKENKYFEKMHAMYLYCKEKHGGNGLYNPADGLWWRDKDFVPPYKEPNGEDCYWSRGNGWVVAAMVRTLEELPANSPYRAEYEGMLKTMSAALLKLQRDDGFWNSSLHDPNNYGGMEATGTALFVYGMSWGIRHGLLDRATYEPAIAKAWAGLLKHSIQPSGFLGYVQGTGKEPKDGQPLSDSKIPDFEDYGLGCVLLSGTEVIKLVRGEMPTGPAK